MELFTTGHSNARGVGVDHVRYQEKWSLKAPLLQIMTWHWYFSYILKRSVQSYLCLRFIQLKMDHIFQA